MNQKFTLIKFSDFTKLKNYNKNHFLANTWLNYLLQVDNNWKKILIFSGIRIEKKSIYIYIYIYK